MFVNLSVAYLNFMNLFISRHHYIPPFAKGKQLSTKACTRTRWIASIRIHVERGIQRMKKFWLLQGVIPIRIAAVANQVVFVCAALCIFLKPLVKM